jgi:hypothetical protein
MEGAFLVTLKRSFYMWMRDTCRDVGLWPEDGDQDPIYATTGRLLLSTRRTLEARLENADQLDMPLKVQTLLYGIKPMQLCHYDNIRALLDSNGIPGFNAMCLSFIRYARPGVRPASPRAVPFPHGGGMPVLTSDDVDEELRQFEARAPHAARIAVHPAEAAAAPAGDAIAHEAGYRESLSLPEPFDFGFSTLE